MDIMERDLLKQDTTEDMVVIEALVVDRGYGYYGKRSAEAGYYRGYGGYRGF